MGSMRPIDLRPLLGSPVSGVSVSSPRRSRLFSCALQTPNPDASPWSTEISLQSEAQGKGPPAHKYSCIPCYLTRLSRGVCVEMAQG